MAQDDWLITGGYTIVADPTTVLNGNVFNVGVTPIVPTELILAEEIGTATPFSMKNIRLSIDHVNSTVNNSYIFFRLRRQDDDNYYDVIVRWVSTFAWSSIRFERVVGGVSSLLQQVSMPASMWAANVKHSFFAQALTLANGDVELGLSHDGGVVATFVDPAASAIDVSAQASIGIQNINGFSWSDNAQHTELALV